MQFFVGFFIVFLPCLVPKTAQPGCSVVTETVLADYFCFYLSPTEDSGACGVDLSVAEFTAHAQEPT
jgi:hypothetical protein